MPHGGALKLSPTLGGYYEIRENRDVAGDERPHAWVGRGLAGGGRSPVAGTVGFAFTGCPAIEWRLARHDGGRMTGRFWYSDLSGTSVAVGHIDQAGRFHTVLTSAIDEGPVGVVDGQRSPDGSVVADLKGEGCANYHSVRMAPVPNISVGGESG